MEFLKNFISITEKITARNHSIKISLFPLPNSWESIRFTRHHTMDRQSPSSGSGKPWKTVSVSFSPPIWEKTRRNDPEDMRVTFEKLKDKCPTMEQFTDLLGKHMNKYNNTPSGGIDMDGKCPDQVYFENLAVKNEVHDKSILRILCGTFDERTVQKNGVQYQGRFYYHTDLIAHQGEKVIINYDPSNMDELNVFDENMRAICKAAAKVRTPFRHTTQEQIREAMKEKKNARKLVEQYAPTRELDVMAIVARNQLVEKQFTEGEHTKTIENINPVLSENSKILEESTKQRRTSREENLLGKLMEASNQ